MKGTVFFLAVVAATPASAGANCYVVDRYIQCFGTGTNEGATMLGSTVAGTTRLYETDRFGNTDTWVIQNNSAIDDLDDGF